MQINKNDLENELVQLANKINMDLDTLKSICESNALDFSLIESQIKTELFSSISISLESMEIPAFISLFVIRLPEHSMGVSIPLLSFNLSLSQRMHRAISEINFDVSP